MSLEDRDGHETEELREMMYYESSLSTLMAQIWRRVKNPNVLVVQYC